jgi:type III secretion system YscQ/HrcQ family protein
MHTHDIDTGIGHPSRAAAPARGKIRLREVDEAQAQLARRLGTGLQAELTLDAATLLRLEVSGLRPTSTRPSRRPLQLQTRAGTLALSPAREVVRALASIELPDQPNAGPDTDPLHALRLDMAAQALPSGCLPLFGASTFLVGDADEQGPLELTLTIFRPQARLGIAATLRGTAEALLHALSQGGWQPIDDAASMTASVGLSLTVPVCIGTTEIALPALDALAPGDVVLVTQPIFGLDGDGELQIAKGTARCLLHVGNRTQVELTEWHPTTAGPTMNDDLDPHAKSSASAHDVTPDAPLDDVSVTLSFELGSLELTLADLRTLAPGRVLDIAGATTPLVAICAGRRRIGLGELVDLGGRLAVEVRRIGSFS